MNKFYLAGLVITLLIAIRLLYKAWYKDVPSKSAECSDWDYEDEVKKYPDLKSGKSTEYEG